MALIPLHDAIESFDATTAGIRRADGLGLITKKTKIDHRAASATRRCVILPD
jgi:hypothetical protein